MSSDEVVIGIDSGLSTTKVVVFDAEGTTLGEASNADERLTPKPRWVERDMDALWETAAATVKQAIAAAGVDADAVMGVAVTAHGDGLYLVDADGRPVRPGINSLDTRTHELLARWTDDGTAEQLLQRSGQEPSLPSPGALLGWMAEHEPEALERAAWALYCKDWIKLCLTGEVATDPTEASESFTNVETQEYDREVLALYGVGDRADLLPPIVACGETMGTVTDAAAELTGLRPGTPVASGLHDVDASALGSGSVRPGDMTMIAGTYSINEFISTEPVRDGRFLTRNFVTPGQYMHMAVSPASATNLDWFVHELARDRVERAEREGGSAFAFVDDALAEVEDDDAAVVFLPFLYGSPHGAAASAGFLGVRGWHGRSHLVRAVLEGVVCNHRTHIDHLREHFDITSSTLTGGGARSHRWAQLFADICNLSVRVPAAEEAGALGTAMCAMVAGDLYPDLPTAVEQLTSVAREYEPDPARRDAAEAIYDRYRTTVEQLGPVWERLAG